MSWEHIGISEMIKVEPSMEGDEESKAQGGQKSRYANVFIMLVWTVAGFLGLLPFKIDKETKECSFKWFSTETIFAFARLVLFNIPLSVLPCVLFLLNFNAEWGDDDDADKNQWGKNNETGNLSSAELVQTIDYFSNFSLFFLSKLQKQRVFRQNQATKNQILQNYVFPNKVIA